MLLGGGGGHQLLHGRGVGVRFGNKLPEALDLQARQRISNGIIHPRNMLHKDKKKKSPFAAEKKMSRTSAIT